MSQLFLTLRQLVAFRAFLLRRIARYSIAEIFFFAARRLPTLHALWDAAFALNPHHLAAALDRAQLLAESNDPHAAQAFQFAVRILDNPERVSASDLALTNVPANIIRKLTGQNALQQENHYKQIFRTLAGEPPLDTTTAPPYSPRDAWAHVESMWTQQQFIETLTLAAPLIYDGAFTSPLDTLLWAERFLSDGTKSPEQIDLAAKCLDWAHQWIPERSLTWSLGAQLAKYRKDTARAALYLERAATLSPDDLAIFLAQQNLSRAVPLRESSTTRLQVTAPSTLALDATATVVCVLENSKDTFQVHVLPPAGYGIVPTPRTQPLTSAQPASFEIRAARPDRICGQAWTVTVVAVSASEYTSTKISIAVPDNRRGQFLLLVTEDHELWEERGTLPRAHIQKLLVEKSNFAATQFAPWTHMVEVGTSLALLDWAAESAPNGTARCEWSETRDAVRTHLQEEIKHGNDLQPHLHAFNLPHSPAFPFHLSDEGIVPDTSFLLTAEQHRRDFARAYPPQERIAAIAATVARLEALAHKADPNYRAVLWRSGQLEFGDDPADRAWSAVALLRAGIQADSDIPKKTFPWNSLPRTAYFSAIEDPFAPAAGGELVHLPVTANLEGDFLSDAATLVEIAKRTGDALRDQAGVHVVTLLTHDKFINARRNADEFSLDPAYNEWATIRAHLSGWDAAGARRVTARQAVQALVDDRTWRLTAWLQQETWLSNSCVRYTLLLLGNQIPVSPEFPQWVLVTIPPFLRDHVITLRAAQADQPLVIEHQYSDHFWLRLTAREPEIYCELELHPSDSLTAATTATTPAHIAIKP